MEGEPTRIMLAVNQSTIKGYPHASISSTRAFQWTLHKIVRSNTSGFKLLFLHVQIPDEDGSFSLSPFPLPLPFLSSFVVDAPQLCGMERDVILFVLYWFCGIANLVIARIPAFSLINC